MTAFIIKVKYQYQKRPHFICRRFLFMQIYQTKENKLTGSSYKDLRKEAILYLNIIRRELLHRFQGITPNGEIFCVQIKETKTNGKKY